jgi:hypothetical protein
VHVFRLVANSAAATVVVAVTSSQPTQKLISAAAETIC